MRVQASYHVELDPKCSSEEYTVKFDGTLNGQPLSKGHPFKTFVPGGVCFRGVLCTVYTHAVVT